ncbi:hypothetical protein BDV97DRAFT_402497 [Delphinella strobiligena]|nr:hypothetical protein BDV97DRAFT_402497 [Delphinella strobiligena]
MSRPWQFSEDGARSPFDRPAPNASAQPPSFQINVNRQKSKKWTEAKNYNYDGDDWGGYDEYNEYGTYDDDEDGTESEPAPLPSAAVLKHRSNSFDRGDEQRSFSAGAPITPQKHANAPSQSTSSTGRASQGPYEIRRDFTQPAHVPPPLNFRASRDASPAPPPVPNITNAGSPSGATHPPRKSSLSGSIPTDLYSSPTAKPASSGTTTGTSLPFIRPADIYKRMQAEKEKDKERQPSLGPLTDGSESMNASHQYGRPGFTVDNPVLARAIGANVAADPAEGSSTPSAPEVASVSDTLPPVNRVASAFGSEFWGASELSESLRLNDDSSVSATANLKPSTGPELTVPQPQATQRSLQHQPSLGFHSVVHEAFDRHDDTHIPLTPISRDNSSSQNGSDTSGISPIMSHVPSTAAAEFRARAREASVPPIAEESSLPESPDLGQSQVVQRKPSPAQSQTHSRTTSGEGLPVSYTPGYRRSLDPPSQESTPVRTPELEFTKRLSHPMAAETALHLPREDTDPVKPLPADYSKRESDLAEEASSSPDKSVFSVAAASHVARANFLQAHSPTLSTSPTFSRPASRSPSPGRQSPGGASRVQQLAGKFDNMHALSRTSSGLSIRSKSSVQSWERSEENLPLKRTGTFESGKSDKDELGLPEYDNADIKGLLTPARPEPTSVPSFRPHLPGEWVSYIDTPRNSKIAVESEVTPRETEEFTATDPSSAASSGAPRPTSTSPATDPVDLAPTTAKQKLHERDISERESSSIDAVKAAGEALGTALMSSMGLGGGHQTRDFAEPEKFLSPEAPSAAPEQNRPSVRDVYLCPLAIDEAASSVGSSVAPTPLPKDTPEGRGMQRSSGYFPAPVLRVGSDDHNLDSPEDMESDRLRKEIERSLSPQTLMNTEKHDQIKRDQDALDGPANLRDHQEAEQLPPATTPDLSMPSLSVAPAEFAPGGIPTLLNKRFSWEKRAETSEPLFAPEGAEPTEPRAPYERPISNQGLHIVNANISADSSAATTPVLQEPSNTLQGSIITSQPVELEAAGLAPHQGLQSTDDTSDVSAIPSPSFDHQPSQEDSVAEPPLERPIVERSGTGSGSSIPTVTASAGGDTTRIPPFREILALKSSPERISKYNETRTQFAATDTGLSNWLSSTLASNPEHADLTASISSSGSGGSNVIGSTRQKPAAKIMQNARNLLPLRENASADTETAGSGGPQRKVSVGQSGAFQAKGKDFMKSAGVFGGKASVGAKGLFAKAKGKLREGGNEKVD